MLTGLNLKNFKCFDSLELRLAPLTLLCGFNGTGKTSVIQSLLLLRQSKVGGGLDTGKLFLGGPLVDLGTGRDVLFEDSTSEVINFSLQSSSTSETLSLESECIKDEHRLNITSLISNESCHEFQPNNPSQHPRNPANSVVRPTGDEWQWDHIPPFGGEVFYVSSERIIRSNNALDTDSLDHCADFGDQRGRSMDCSSVVQDRLLPRSDPRCNEIAYRHSYNVVEHWFERLISTPQLRLERVVSPNAGAARFSFIRRGRREQRPYRAANVGIGSMHIVPVLMALLAPSGSLCLIENPEAHLHPRNQSKLSELAVRAALAGVQVIVETHSEYFLDGIRVAIRDQMISPSNVALHYFQHTGTKAEVTSPAVDSDGRLSSWPEGFFDQHESNLSKLLAPKP